MRTRVPSGRRLCAAVSSSLPARRFASEFGGTWYHIAVPSIVTGFFIAGGFVGFIICAEERSGRPNDRIATPRRSHPRLRLFGGSGILTLANHFADFAREGLGGERFLEQFVVRIEQTMVSDLVVGITGNVKDLHVGPELAEFSSQF